MPGQGDLRVELQFNDLDIIADLKEDTPYRITGRVQRMKPGTPILMKSVTIMPPTTEAAALAAAPPRPIAMNPMGRWGKVHKT